MIKLNIQHFATNTNVTTDSGLSPEMKTYYEKRLITEAGPELIFDQFADKYPIPANNGKTIQMRKFAPLDTNLEKHKLTEGVTPDGSKLNVTELTAEIDQYGDYVEVSDMVSLTAIDPVISQATQLSGSQAGRLLNKVTRNALSCGTKVLFAPDGKSGTEVKFRKDLTDDCVLTPAVVRKAANALKRVNAPKIDGSYVAIVHPDVATDLMSDKEWIDVNKYSAAAHIFEGEIGKLAGVRFIENTEAACFYIDKAQDTGLPVEKGEATNAQAVYFCYFLGGNAYGTTELENGGLQQIVKPLGSGQDPLNQRATVGWKATKTAEILVEDYLLRVECGSSEGANAIVNY